MTLEKQTTKKKKKKHVEGIAAGHKQRKMSHFQNHKIC